MTEILGYIEVTFHNTGELSVHAFPEKLTHDFGAAITVIYCFAEQKHLGLQKHLVASDFNNCMLHC